MVTYMERDMSTTYQVRVSHRDSDDNEIADRILDEQFASEREARVLANNCKLVDGEIVQVILSYPDGSYDVVLGGL